MEAKEEELFVVQIVERDTEKIVYQSEPTYARRAEKIEDGMSINLDWDHCATRVVPASEAGEVVES